MGKGWEHVATDDGLKEALYLDEISGLTISFVEPNPKDDQNLAKPWEVSAHITPGT
jgi:hypothetical protein